MQWLKKLFTHSASNGVFVGGEKWIPRPLCFRFRDQDTAHLIDQMTPEQRLACIADPRGELGEAEAVLARCREESNRLRAEGHTVED